MNIKNIKEIDDGKFEIRFSYIDELTGKRRRVRRRIEGTVADAIEYRDTLKRKAKNGNLGRSERVDKPLSEWLDDYLEHRKKVDQVAPSTLENETLLYSSNIVPDIGDWRPDAVELHHLDQLVSEWLTSRKDNGEPYSTTTIHNRVGYLTRLLRWVFKRIGKPTGFLRDVDRPAKAKRRKGRVLSPEEVKSLLDGLTPFWAILAYSLLVTGQRWGAVTALRWSDVDFVDETITFERSHYRGQVREGNKSGDIVRIPMPDALSRRLKRHRQWMMKTQRAGFDTGLVFPARVDDPDDAANNGFIESASLRKQMQLVCDELGIDRCSPHDLRRTHNTMLVESGVEGTIIRSITGHSDEAMTDHYYHGSKQAKSDALNRVVSMVD